MTPPSKEQPDDFYAKLDAAKSQGRGSCCTAWSFFLLLGTLLLLGIAFILLR